MQSSLQLDLLISGWAFPPTPQLWWQQNLALRARNFETVIEHIQITWKSNQECGLFTSCLHSVADYYSTVMKIQSGIFIIGILYSNV